MPLLEAVQFWHWWALGGVLVTIEMLAPGVMFLWLGVAAALVGGLLLLWPGLALSGQILVFAALSVVNVLARRRDQKAHPVVTDEPNLNRRAARCIGERAALATPIVNGRGRISLGDGSWPVIGPDLPAGTAVEVVGVDGTHLQVQPFQTESVQLASTRDAAAPARPEQTPA
jgi:membrane protein implicated in regulation of membrane protease activity